MGFETATASRSRSYPGDRITSPCSTSRRTLSTSETTSPSCRSLYVLARTRLASSLMSCFMRTCALIAGASPVGPGEENRWHHANWRLQRLIVAVFGQPLYVDGQL